jgi:4-oxalocrotonate tautomerase
MPYINLKVAGTLDRSQKEQIAKEFSETLHRVTGKPTSATYLVIDEVERENWAKGAQLLG